MKNRIIYFPLILFLLYFALDKVMLLPSVQRLTQSDATYLYFQYKSELMDEMKQVYDSIRGDSTTPYKKKIFMIMGSSRFLYFDYKTYRQTFPDWEMFNFSAPVTAPAYYAYILQRVLDRNIHPDYLLIEVDPYQYNEGSDAFVRSNLAYSFDLPFILGHSNLLKPDEISTYVGKSLFAAFRYTPDLNVLIKRLNNHKDQRLLALDMLDKFQRENRGGGKSLIPREDWYERDFARLMGTSERTLIWLYGNYKISDRQFQFLRMTLEMADRAGIKVILVRPPVSRPMDRLLKEDKRIGPAIQKWEHRMDHLLEDYSVTYLNLLDHPDYYCNSYVDGAHMSLDCYHPFMMLVMDHYPVDGNPYQTIAPGEVPVHE